MLLPQLYCGRWGGGSATAAPTA